MDTSAGLDRKEYWDKIYKTKQPTEVSWFEETPMTSLDFVKQLNLPRSARIIDNGAGESFLVDHLLKLGYENITVLDISEAALIQTQKRLGKNAEKVNWVVADE